MPGQRRMLLLYGGSSASQKLIDSSDTSGSTMAMATRVHSSRRLWMLLRLLAGYPFAFAMVRYYAGAGAQWLQSRNSLYQIVSVLTIC